MDFVDPFGWHSVDADRLKVIHERLGQLETQTWGDILIQAKKQNHSVAIDSLCKEARDRAEYALFETLGPGARVGFSIKGFSLFCGGTLTTLFVHPCANDS